MKTYSSISSQIKAEVQNYIWKPVEIAPDVWFSAYNTIKTAIQYYLSYFESGEYDNEGFKKYFYNIVRNPCLLMQKMINFDTKDIRFLTDLGGREIETWLMERDFRYWLKDNDFGQVLNYIFESIPVFGSAVLKVIGNKIEPVPIKNLYVEPTAVDIRSANWVIEVHPYTLPEFVQESEKMGWDYKPVIEKFTNSDAKYITVYERTGYLKQGNSYPLMRAFTADAGQTEQDRNRGIRTEDIELGKETIEKTPYWDFHGERIAGRWLGLGLIEILKDPQIRTNEIFNLQVKSSYWNSLNVFQTRDSGVNRNLMTEVKNGEILYTEQPVERIDFGDRNLSGYQIEKNDWMANRDEQTMSSPLLQGGRLPSRTPAVVAQMLISQAGSYFAFVQERIALRLKEMLYEEIIPIFQKQKNTEHYLRLVGKDLDQYRSLMIEKENTQSTWDWIMRNSSLPTTEERTLLEGIVKEKWNKLKEHHILIPKGLYNNLKYKIEIDIVGEARDTKVESSNLQMALQFLIQDPTILTNPAKRKIFVKFLDDNGLSIEDIAPEEATGGLNEAIQQATKSLGGGISRPTPTPTSVPTKTL